MTAWLLVAVLLARFWWLLLAVGILAGVWHVLREMASAASTQRELALREAEVVAARADEQQALVLAGDERGVYGEYEPAVSF